jgi:hypothetical protein
MSHLIDQLAREVAEPMPRRRAVRIIFGTLAGVAFGATRPPSAQAIICTPPEYHCDCPASNGLFYRWCCSPNEDCKCIPPPNGGAYCQCNPSHKCGSSCCQVDEFCGDKASGTCCKQHQVACGKTCCAEGTECANADIEYCCGRAERACQGTSTVSCCSPSEACCNGRCCAPGLRCHKGKCQKCPPKTKECGDTHCCERRETCCNGKCCGKKQHCCFDDHCCDDGQTCCGDGKCCDAKDEKCCGDHCCGKDQDCCGKGCCPKGKNCAQLNGSLVCCPPSKTIVAGSVQVCCGSGQIAVNNRCCPANTPNCTKCNPPCRGNDYCFDGQCFHTTRMT